MFGMVVLMFLSINKLPMKMCMTLMTSTMTLSFILLSNSNISMPSFIVVMMTVGGLFTLYMILSSVYSNSKSVKAKKSKKLMGFILIMTSTMTGLKLEFYGMKKMKMVVLNVSMLWLALVLLSFYLISMTKVMEAEMVSLRSYI